MKVHYSDQALAELQTIHRDLMALNPVAARRFADRVFRVHEQIETFPNGFQEVSRRPGIRRAPLVHFPYLVFYRVSADAVMVLSVRHGARDDILDNL
ncbi:MAG: type II toxin-antitoxin system RelE/ParE family toxin [Pseudolabrys sp.]|nr:type II toxin-antitoxin system RelE/ParE family toxin [Pseudolabrys sp.]MDP2294535.1 type II toxin-antitoxin system RelE/ParE family toxin [Pseudolabrys sp.]